MSGTVRQLFCQCSLQTQARKLDEEVAEWEPKIAEIVGWFGQLQAVDVEGVEPALRADVDVGNRLREDVPHHYADRETLIEGAPQKEGPYIKVPKTL
ncbi:hypothetical protein WJX72_010188 [[Myrmecia] bisecta]|uniref:Glu-AdT subunit C n=1 Tax=[Myrmecia] bisecta TaxID=41462 RepID=A0AAW1PP44_9CHLO